MISTDILNDATRAAYARWLALRSAGKSEASAAAYAEYEAARSREADAYASTGAETRS